MLAAASWSSVMWCGATGCYVLLIYKSKAHEFNWEHFRSIEAHIDCAKRSWFELYTWIINNYVVLIYGAYAVWTWTWTILGGETYSISVEVEKWEWYGYWFCWFSGKRLIILMHYIYLMRTKLYLVPKAHTSVQLPPVDLSTKVLFLILFAWKISPQYVLSSKSLKILKIFQK